MKVQKLSFSIEQLASLITSYRMNMTEQDFDKAFASLRYMCLSLAKDMAQGREFFEKACAISKEQYSEINRK